MAKSVYVGSGWKGTFETKDGGVKTRIKFSINLDKLAEAGYTSGTVNLMGFKNDRKETPQHPDINLIISTQQGQNKKAQAASASSEEPLL